VRELFNELQRFIAQEKLIYPAVCPKKLEKEPRAEILNIDRKTLYRKLKKIGLA